MNKNKSIVFAICLEMLLKSPLVCAADKSGIAVTAIALAKETIIIINLLAFKPNSAYQSSIVSELAWTKPAIIGWKVYWSTNENKVIPESIMINGIACSIISTNNCVVETRRRLLEWATKLSSCFFLENKNQTSKPIPNAAPIAAAKLDWITAWTYEPCCTRIITKAVNSIHTTRANCSTNCDMALGIISA